MTSRPLSLCLACTHNREDGTCDAYPDGIPRPILVNLVDHRVPLPGDHDVTFDLYPPAEPIYDSWVIARDLEAADNIRPPLPLAPFDKGSPPGHPFFGNQYVAGTGGEATVSQIASRIPRHPYGFTLDSVTGQDAKSGYACARSDTPSLIVPTHLLQTPAGQKAMADYIKSLRDAAKADPTLHLGGWLDRAHGEFVLDHTTVHPNTPEGRSAAIKMGIEGNQQSIFHIDSLEEIPTGGTGGRDDDSSRQGTIRTVYPTQSPNAARRGPVAKDFFPLAGFAGLHRRSRHDRRGVRGLGAGLGAALRKAAHDVSQEARGQPDNAGEWVAGAGSRATAPKSKLPISMGPIIAPHNADTIPTTVNKKPGPPRKANVNYDATKMSGQPPAYRDKLLAQVLKWSPNGDLTPDKIDAQLDQLLSEALGHDSTGKKVSWSWDEKDAKGKFVRTHTDVGDADAIAAKHWYNDAHDFSVRIGKLMKLTPRQSCAFVAALSPRLDWGSNEVTAEFAAKALGNPDTVCQLEDKNLAHVNALAERSLKGHRISRPVTVHNGMKLADMKDENEVAFALLGMMGEAHLQNGDIKADGTPSTSAVPLPASLAKSVLVFRKGDNSDPDQILGGHKVRSFFNNILDPDDLAGNHDVTMDTHAVNAAAGARFGMKSVTLDKMFGSAPSNTEANSTGTYPVFADAYRRLAAKYKMLPSQAQAIVWVHWQTTGHHVGRREGFPEAK